MTPQETGPETLLGLLGAARAQLARSVRRQAVAGAAYRAGWGAGLSAAAALAGWAFFASRSIPAPRWFFPVLAGTASVVGGVAALRAVLRVRRCRPGWRTVAERLDAACGGHNQIATALELLQQPERSGFAAVAILEGIERARQVAERSPLAPQLPAGRGRGEVAAAGLIALSLLVVAGWPRAGDGPATIARTIVGDAAGPAHGAVATPAPRAHRSPVATGVRPAAPGERQEAEGRGSRPAAASPSNPSPRVQNNPTGMPTAQARASSAAAASAGVARSQNDALSPALRPQRDSPLRAAQPTTPSSAGESAASEMAIPGGRASGGAMKSVSGQTRVREAPPAADAELMDDAAPLEETTSSSNQRGGIQPSLPDRTAAPSRELGITGPKSKRPGTGRGGPSPLKKARGTAALLMGVPTPDFIFGKLGPGPVASTLENSPPQERVADAAPAAPARTRTDAESPAQPDLVPWSAAAAVTHYLERWHGRDLASASDAPSAPSTATGLNGENGATHE